MSEICKIHVYDQEYELRINSESGKARLEKVAALVDHKMNEVGAHYVSMTAKHIAVLAALNLADEILELQEKMLAHATAADGQPGGPCEDRMLAYAGRIERCLGGKA